MGIERYRTIVRLEEIQSFLEQGDYEAAKEVADSIRKERLKDSSDLFLLATVYRKCGELAAAKEFLRRIYEKKVTWRVLEELMEVCLAEKNPEEAETYLKEYAKISGGDPRNYIYEYRIGRQMHRPDEELLPVLQTLKAEEYTEKYAYELAKLYHKLGREQECMAECADLILWFGEGTYVERAKALQAYYRGELSAEDIRVEAERRTHEAEERRIKEEEEARRFEEEERLAVEAVYRSMAEERFGRAQEQRSSEEGAHPVAAEEKGSGETAPETEEPYCPELEDAFAEVAATECAEPMWEADAFVSLPVEEPQAVSELGKELSARLSEQGIVFEDILHEYGRIERVRKQLVRMLEVVVTVRKRCHCLIITGEKKSGKTTLGTYLAKLLYELSYVKSPRVAKISGERLNRMNLQEKKEQLKDVCLIVEEAGAMTGETVENLLEFIQHANVLGTVILEDNAGAMSRLLRNHGEANRMFNNRVHLPKYDSNELRGFALEYIREQDYKISKEALKILEQRIAYLTRVEKKDGRLAATLETVKEAIKNADYRNQGTILAMASAGNFLAAGALELTAEDFGVIR